MSHPPPQRPDELQGTLGTPAPTDPRRVGRYRLRGRLGAGGMGVVHAATDPRGRPVALKRVHREYAADRDFRQRFAREVELVSRVGARCVPRFLAADTRTSRPWLATEYVPGPTLRRHVTEHGPLSGPRLRAFAAGVAEALTAIHAQGVVHRDLKPANVILGPAGPKVLDFGIARAVDASAITRTGEALGTPGWVPPETFLGHDPSPAGDVFAWGMLVAYAATGREPFGKATPQALAVRILERPADTDGVPRDLLPLVESALDKDPERRPSAERLLTGCVSLLGAEAPTATDATRVLPGALDQVWEAPTRVEDPRWASRTAARRRRVLNVSAAVLSVVLVVVLGLFAGFRSAEGPEDARASGGEGEAEGVGEGDRPVEEVLAEANAGRDFDGLFVQLTGETQMVVLNRDLPAYPEDEIAGLAEEEQESRRDALEAAVDITDVDIETGDPRFRVSAEFLDDEGAFALRSEDFSVHDAIEWPGGPPDPNRDTEAFDTFPARADETLVLTPEDPEGEITFTTPDAPTEGGYVAYAPDPEGVLGPDARGLPTSGSYVCFRDGPQGAPEVYTHVNAPIICQTESY